ncbi:hypothetical protein [Sphingopyxis sp.]|jgi:hypothetical protein
MTLPVIDIDAVPLLDTAVGLFGSLAGAGATASTPVFDVAISVMLIIYD